MQSLFAQTESWYTKDKDAYTFLVFQKGVGAMKLIIDGRSITVTPGQSLLDAVKALGLVTGKLSTDPLAAKIAGEEIDKNSIEIPVYLRYDFALPLVSKIAVPFVAVGPQFGFAFGSTKEEFEIDNIKTKYQFKKSNVSLNLGLGAIVLSKIQLHVNYNIALGKTSELSEFSGVTGALGDVIDSKTNTWQISAAYLF